MDQSALKKLAILKKQFNRHLFNPVGKQLNRLLEKLNLPHGQNRDLDLEAERASIKKMGRLHWFHWLAIALSLVLTIGAWQFTKQQVEERNKNLFDRASNQVLELVAERMQKYEDGLWGGVSAIRASDDYMDYKEWRVFAKNLKLDVKYPGINGIGIIHQVKPEHLNNYLRSQRLLRPDYKIHPPHKQNIYMPITYIEPTNVNAKAVGLDMAHENNRFSAALRARDTGTAQITAPIVLVQDNAKTPGFLFYVPYYARGENKTLEDRQKNFLGMVYAPFVFHKLTQGALNKEKREVSIRVLDKTNVLYNENKSSEKDYDPNPMFAKTLNLDLYGRSWSFDIQTTNSFRTAHSSSQPMMILMGGILIDTLLFALFTMLSGANRRALNFANRISDDLNTKTEELKQSEAQLADMVEDLKRANNDLKRFAYVASHDLQEPLRKLHQFSGFLVQDCSGELSKDASYFLDVIRSSSNRMSALIRDLLTYSKSANRDFNLVEVDLTEITNSLISELETRIEETNAKIKISNLPSILADRNATEHVMRNLISNAIKYHAADRTPEIEITETIRPDNSKIISVKDNGIGIDMKFKDRILEPFQRLHNKMEYPGTGIGLAVCKTICERHGWTLKVESEPGKGSTFSIIIPSQAINITEELKHAS